MTDVEKYGVVVTRLADDVDGWRAVEVRHLTGAENNGNHHIYVDTYQVQDPAATLSDADGKVIETVTAVQVVNVPVLCWWSGEAAPEPEPAVYALLHTWSEKPLTEPGCNFPMYSQHSYAVAIAGAPSEIVAGLHTRHADEEAGNTLGHHSFYVRFEYQAVCATADPTGPRPGETLDEYVRRRCWDAVGVNYNADAAFFRYAQEHGLGKPETQEVDVTYDGVSYRVQAYVMGIVFCRVGDWGNIRFIRW